MYKWLKKQKHRIFLKICSTLFGTKIKIFLGEILYLKSPVSKLLSASAVFTADSSSSSVLISWREFWLEKKRSLRWKRFDWVGWFDACILWVGLSRPFLPHFLPNQTVPWVSDCWIQSRNRSTMSHNATLISRDI